MDAQSENDDFILKKTLLELEKSNIELKHRLKMEEIAAERANSILIHEQILERGRIQRAEERKLVMFKRG